MAKGTRGAGNPNWLGGSKNNPPSDEQKPITLAEAGVDKNLAQRAREAAALSEKKFEDRVADKRDSIINRTSFTGNNEWFTPLQYLPTEKTLAI
jgi:hypothetical protein